MALPTPVPLAGLTQTVVAVTATSGQLVAANKFRKILVVQNIGANIVTIVPGTGVATSGQGMILGAAAASPGQGGTMTFDAAVSADAFQVICPAAQTSTVTVWEG